MIKVTLNYMLDMNNEPRQAQNAESAFLFNHNHLASTAFDYKPDIYHMPVTDDIACAADAVGCV